MKRIIFLTVCLFMFVGCSTTAPIEEKPKEEIPKEEPPRVVIEIPNAITMVDVYYNNELNGNKQYFNKWIQTTALFDEIDHSWTGDLWVYFDAKNANGYYGHYGLLCDHMSKEEKEKISNFNKGKPVTFIGYSQGLLAGARIEFEKCEFIKW